MAEVPRLLFNDDIERRILRNDEEEAKQVLTRNAHGRKGWWTNNNQLGFRVPFQPATSPLDPSQSKFQTILRLDEAGLPRVWTISLGIDIQGELGAGEAFEAIGKIDFGAGGVTQTVEVDWLQGTVMSLVMNAVDVRAQWLRADSILPDGVFLTAQISRGALARSIATRSFFVTVDPASDGPEVSDVFPIPPFARSVELIPRNAGDIPNVYSATTLFTMGPNSSVAISAGAITGDYLAPGVTFPIPIFAKYWQLSNDAGATLNCTVKFNLFDI